MTLQNIIKRILEKLRWPAAQLARELSVESSTVRKWTTGQNLNIRDVSVQKKLVVLCERHGLEEEKSALMALFNGEQIDGVVSANKGSPSYYSYTQESLTSIMSNKLENNKILIPLKKVPDMDTTEHDMIERFPKLISRYTPSHEILEYMWYEAACGQSAMSEYKHRMEVPWAEADTVRNEYEQFFNICSSFGYDTEYWKMLCRSWNKPNSGIEPGKEYHNWLVKEIVKDIIAKSNGNNSFTEMQMDNLVCMLEAIEKEGEGRYNIGTHEISEITHTGDIDADEQRKDCFNELYYVIDQNSIAYLISNNANGVGSGFICDLFKNVKEIPKYAQGAGNNLKAINEEGGLKQKTFLDKLKDWLFKILNASKEIKEIQREEKYILVCDGITDLARDFIAWYKDPIAYQQQKHDQLTNNVA